MKLARRLLEEVLREGERAYPEEACGFLTGAKGAVERVVPIANAAEKMKAERPDEFTRDARRGYVMDPQQQLRAMQAEDRAGREILAIYHSHADVGAYFSEEDRRRAAPDGEPLFPDVLWLVADVRAAKGLGAKVFAWSASALGFVEEPLELE